jgi:putative ABC transport system ATP-binding protein
MPEAVPTEPATDPATAGALLRRTVRRHLRRIVPFVALLTLWQVCETAVPVLVGVVIDRAVLTSDVGALLLWGAVLAGLFGVLSLSYRYGARLGFAAAQQEMHLVRMEVTGRALDPHSTRTHRAGEVLALSTGDAANIGFSIRALGYTLAATGSLVFSAWVLLRIDVGLGLVVMVGSPLVLAGVQALTPVLARRTRAHEASTALATGAASDLVAGLRVLHGIGATREAVRRYRTVSQAAKGAGIASSSSFGSVLGLTAAASGAFGALIALLAALMAMRGEITVGELVAVVGLSQFLDEPLNTLGNISAQYAQARGSARRVVEFLADTTPRAGGDAVPARPATLDLDLSGEHLAGLRLASRPGELLGVCVPDPAAAAELVRALGGGDAGVRLGGVALADVDPARRPGHLVVAPHHVDLFEGSVRGNLDPSVRLGDAVLLDALAAAAGQELLDAGDLGTRVDAGGSTLSGGQRQRLALARALACGTDVLVLHDPTTAVDSVTERHLADGLRALRHPEGSTATTWLVTSSPTLLDRADRVVLVRDGAVVAEGTHRELLARTAYAEAVLR